MSSVSGDPVLLNHFSVLIYPFRHHLHERRSAQLRELQPRWQPWTSRFDEDELTHVLDATTFFLPYIRGLLYPEVPHLARETGCEDHRLWAKELRARCADEAEGYYRELANNGVVRLTLRPRVQSHLGAFHVIREQQPDLPVQCDWIDAWMFSTGLGFLVWKVRLEQEQPRLSELIRLNQTLRQVLPNSRYRAPKLRLLDGRELEVRDWIDFLTMGLAAEWNLPTDQRADFPPAQVPPAYAQSEAGRTYGERCHVVSYASVDLVGLTAEELPAGAFACGTDRLVFELATSIPLGDSVNNPMWVPSHEQAQRICSENRLSLWRCWTGMVLKESLIFLGTEDLHFTRKSLARHIENEYLPLYLFVLFQKLQLFTYSTELMHEVAGACGRLRGARAILHRFVAFRSQFWFSEVTRRPQGGELYHTLQRGLEVQAMHELVTGSVKEIKDYYESLWSRQVQWLKDALTFGGPVMMLAGMSQMILGVAMPWLLAGAAVVAGSSVGVAAWFRRKKTARVPKSPRTPVAMFRRWWQDKSKVGV
jgi:hypothetical protein